MLRHRPKGAGVERVDMKLRKVEGPGSPFWIMAVGNEGEERVQVVEGGRSGISLLGYGSGG